MDNNNPNKEVLMIRAIWQSRKERQDMNSSYNIHGPRRPHHKDESWTKTWKSHLSETCRYLGEEYFRWGAKGTKNNSLHKGPGTGTRLMLEDRQRSQSVWSVVYEGEVRGSNVKIKSGMTCKWL